MPPDSPYSVSAVVNPVFVTPTSGLIPHRQILDLCLITAGPRCVAAWQWAIDSSERRAR